MPQEEKLWSKTLVALMGVNFANVLVFFLLMVELVGYSTSTYGVSTTLAALPNTAYVVSALVARIALGRQIDKWGPMKSLAIGMALNAAACLGYLLPLGFWWLIAMRILHGVGLALQSGSAAAGAVLIIPASRRAEGVGYYSLAQALGSGLGPFVAVMLTGAFSGYHAIFVFSAAISCVSLLLLAVIRLPRVKQPERPKKGFRLRDLVQLDAVPISCVIALVFFCYSGVGSFVVGYAEAERFTTMSVFFLVYSAVIVALRPFAGRRVDRVGENSIIYLTLVSLVIGLLMIALAPNGAVFLAAAAFLGVGVGVTQSVVQAVVAREAPAAEQGRANSTFMMGLDVGSGFGPMILGAVLELLTYREMYLALSVIAAATIVIYYFAHGRKAAKRRN